MNILNCTADQDREKARAETANLQAVVELCRAKKAANKTGEAAPFIKCLSNQLTGPTASAAAVAVKARLDSAKATLAAAEAKAHAKATAAALQPAAPATGISHLAEFERLEGPLAASYYKTHRNSIISEAAGRQHEKRLIEGEMASARASARQLRELNKRTR
jgi:hypothetical protein